MPAPSHSIDAPDLGALLFGLDDILGTHDDGGPLIAALQTGGRDPVVTSLPASVNLVDLLWCFDAEPHWSVAAIIAHGSGLPLAGAPLQAPVPTRVRIGYAVDRHGRSASLLHNLAPPGAPTLAGEPLGRVPDCLRRVMGQPTDPPDQSPEAWWTAVWLGDLLADVAAEPARTWAWPDLAARHPLAPTPPPAGPASLAVAVSDTAAFTTWSILRQAAAAGPGCGPIDARSAAWMDDGMFARWLLAALPEPADVLADLAELLHPAAIEAVRQTLALGDLPC